MLNDHSVEMKVAFTSNNMESSI